MDPKEENDSKIISWCEEHKEEKDVALYLFVGSKTVQKIEENEIDNLDQKDIDKTFGNDVTESGVIKMETDDVNEVTTKELLNYSPESTVKSENIKQEEIHLKHEEDNETCLDDIQQKPGNQSMYQCLECPYITKYKYNLKSHSLRHKKQDEIDWYSCPECLYVASRKNELKRHSETHKTREEKEKPEKILHQCPECSYKTSRKYDLKCHAEIHDSNNLILKCLKCSYETSRPINLKKHQKKHKTNVQRLNCFECSYKTNRRALLQSHLLAHRGDIYKCSSCPYRTGRKGQLAVHQVKHKSMDKWHCCPLCSYKSYDKRLFKRHCRRCHSINPDNPQQIVKFKCTECSYESGHKCTLKRHQLVHDQRSWFQCSDCIFKTPYKSSLKKHQVQHQRENAESL